MSKNNKQLDEKAITEFKQQKRDIGYLISANNLKEAYKRLKAIEKNIINIHRYMCYGVIILKLKKNINVLKNTIYKLSI